MRACFVQRKSARSAANSGFIDCKGTSDSRTGLISGGYGADMTPDDTPDHEPPLRDPPTQPERDPPRRPPGDPIPAGDLPPPGPDIPPLRDPPPAQEPNPPPSDVPKRMSAGVEGGSVTSRLRRGADLAVRIVCAAPPLLSSGCGAAPPAGSFRRD